MLKNNHIYFPNGQPIPNNRSNHGLNQTIDTWLTNNLATGPEALMPLTQPPIPMPFQHNQLLHASLSFEAVPTEVHMAQVTDTTKDDKPASQLDKLYDVCKVLANEKKKYRFKSHDPPTQSTATSTIPPSLPPAMPKPASSYPCTTPQFCYQSNTEDQQLTSQLLNWLLEGKLSQTTLAHILATSAPICKDLTN